MEQVVKESSNANLQAISKTIKKLKIKESPLKQYSMKLAEEYLQTKNNIENLQIEESECKKIEGECIDGLYKQHVTIWTEPKMKVFYNEYNYENLMGEYEHKIDNYRMNNDNYIINVQTKKQLIYTEKTKIIDMLSREFENSKFEKIKLIEISDLNKRELEKLYKKSKEIIESEIEAILPEEREILYDNHLGKLQFIMTNYWYEKENNIQEEPKKHKLSLWEWIKHFFKVKQPKLLEEGIEEKREKKLQELSQILKDVFYEVEYAGCFKSGKIEDRVHIMQIDEANIKSENSISERREMLKEEVLIKI